MGAADAVAEYTKLQQSLQDVDGVVAGQMFGKACLKVGGKAFMAQHGATVVFKLPEAERDKALAQPGAVLWDPSGKGRPMKEWVALTVASKGSFKKFSTAAMAHVQGLCAD